MNNDRVPLIELSRGITGLAPVDLSPIRLNIVIDFYNRVCDRAEQNMAHTGTVSGAHWNAMKQVMREMGIEVTA